jgi:hypothetical protein
MARIVPNYSAFRKRNDRKRVQKSSMTSWPHHSPSGNQKRFSAIILGLFEIARVLVRFNHVARFIVNPNHSVM